ncbi:hypothetical protein [Methylomicrobium album]|uniref:Uncharacterized protein n=1 Tax=Methylomicrobium album BG8 TaxID=686340 RepID=H8GGA9_METAL|nr:hypothetical protein [Methylomicrobium album]EIC31189.1 hypothetical protein Metal_3541 [Methylomicrobium album BG8]
MNVLNELYQNRVDQLQSSLENAESVLDLTLKGESFLQDIISSKGDYGKELTARETRLTSYYFNAFLSGVALASKVDLSQVAPDGSPGNQAIDVKPERLHAMDFAPAAASVLGTLLIPGGIMLAALGGFTLGGFTTVVTKQTKDHSYHGPVESTVSITPAKLSLNPEKVLAAFDLAVKNFDRLNNEIEDIRNEALNENLQRQVNLEDVPNILPFLHELLTYQNDPSVPGDLQKYLESIQRILRGYKIEVIQYESGKNEALFERQLAYGENIAEPMMLKPALVKEDKLLVSGLLLYPEPA